jgi:hypothetical protein
MEKINFVNGSEPALNATNLNQMQDNVENAINDTKTNLENAINDTGNWQDLELINGWENYDIDLFNKAQIKKDKGRVYLRGVLKIDNKTDYVITYFPEGYRPRKMLIISAITNVTHITQEPRRMTIYPDGKMLVSFETTLTEQTGFVSIDGLFFDID